MRSEIKRSPLTLPQDLFEAVFNYFPITFRPPPNDPYGITAQQLKDRLRDCIAANSSFSPHSFPALLDKLDSTSINVKRDALQAIAACVQNYGAPTVHLYSITLWDSVKFEILNSQEEDLANEASVVLFEIARQLSTSPHEGPLQTFLKPIAKECNEHLEDAPTKQSSASGEILIALSKASPDVSNFLVNAIVPHLLRQVKSADGIPRRRGLLEVLVKLVQVNAYTFGHWRESGPRKEVMNVASNSRSGTLRTAPNAFADYATQCQELFTSAITSSPINEVSYRLLAFDGLRAMARVKGLMSDMEIITIVKVGFLDDIVIREESFGKDEVKAAAIDTLVEIAHQKPQLIIEHALPSFMKELPDTDIGHTIAYIPALEAFAKLSGEQQIFATVVLRLKNRLYTALRQQASTKYVLSILSALLYAFLHGAVDLEQPAIAASYYQDIVIPFLKDIVATGPTTFAGNEAVNDESVLNAIGRICNAIMRPLAFPAQTEVCRNVYTLFRDKDIREVPPFSSVDPTLHSSMIVSTYLLASLRREATPHTDIAELLSNLIHYVVDFYTPSSARNAALSQIGLIINKYVSPAQTPVILSANLADISSILGSPLTINKLQSSFAILKGLILRIDPSLPTLIPLFLSILCHPTHGLPTARRFSALLAPSELLSKPNHSQIYGLHKQRLFTLAIPPLVTSFRAIPHGSSPDILLFRETHLIALSGVIANVPYALLRSELAQLTPLLLQSLVLPDPDVKAATIATFATVVREDPALIEEHAASLVARLLDIIVPPANAANNGYWKPADARTRSAALACLASFVGAVRNELLVPLQRNVVRRLGDALDDGRRSVRAEAVRCRVAWDDVGGKEVSDDE